MKVIHQSNIIQLEEDHEVIGYLAYTYVNPKVVNVTRTYVKESHRGKKLADLLLREFVKLLSGQNLQCILTCSYAVFFFDHHPEYQKYVLEK